MLVNEGQYDRWTITYGEGTREIKFKKSKVLSTNGIESLNRSLKHFLGFGNCDLKRLNKEMHSYHSQKLVESFEGLNHGRLRKIRRRTQVRQNSLYEILSDFESLPESQQIETMRL